MILKKCTKCECEKPYAEFSINKSKASGYSSECKACHKIIRKEYYEKNKAKERSRTLETKQRQLQAFKDFKSQLSCKLCSENHPAVLQFHHTDPTEKEIEISLAVRLGWSKQRLQKEIDKCVVLCANCHFKEHYELTHNGKSLLT